MPPRTSRRSGGKRKTPHDASDKKPQELQQEQQDQSQAQKPQDLSEDPSKTRKIEKQVMGTTKDTTKVQDTDNIESIKMDWLMDETFHLSTSPFALHYRRAEFQSILIASSPIGEHLTYEDWCKRTRATANLIFERPYLTDHLPMWAIFRRLAKSDIGLDNSRSYRDPKAGGDANCLCDWLGLCHTFHKEMFPLFPDKSDEKEIAKLKALAVEVKQTMMAVFDLLVATGAITETTVNAVPLTHLNISRQPLILYASIYSYFGYVHLMQSHALQWFHPDHVFLTRLFVTLGWREEEPDKNKADAQCAAVVKRHWDKVHLLNVPFIPGKAKNQELYSFLGCSLCSWTQNQLTVQAAIQLIPAIDLTAKTALVRKDPGSALQELSLQDLAEEKWRDQPHAPMRWGLDAAYRLLPQLPHLTAVEVTHANTGLLPCLHSLVISFLFSSLATDVAPATAVTAAAETATVS